MLYSLLKPILFSLDPEMAHDISLKMLQQFNRIIPDNRNNTPTRVMGLDFPNPVGLAAGMDKNGEYLNGLSRLGFGFIEVGSVTPKAQPGNPQPRIFRLSEYQSLINRMGFNNKGVDYLLHQIGDNKRDFVLGINIGKNLNTPVDQALSDYRMVFEKVYTVADYIAINISSPNTPGLRELQNQAALKELLSGVDQLRTKLEDRYQVYRPLALKLSPDLDPKAIPAIADLLREYRVDGLIATNTTIDRDRVREHKQAAQGGGLSGTALRDKSRQMLDDFYRQLKQDIPIISVGGIDSVEEARLRLDLGAKLIQIYTGLIYRGPGLVNSITKSLQA